VSTPKYILLGAARWLAELRLRDLSSARSSLKTAPAYRTLTPTQYESAFEWLLSRDLVSVSGEVLDSYGQPAAQVMRKAIDEMEPPWLADADSLIKQPADLPLDVLEIGEVLEMGQEDVFDEVKRAWRKFDDTAQRELGAAGELAMMGWLEEHCDGDVIHVSSYDDTAGYDIALEVNGARLARIEVKATRRIDSAVVYLSRNEFETMRRSPTWCLQVISLNAGGDIRSIGWLPSALLEDWAPRDRPGGVWQSMRLSVPIGELRPGSAPPVNSMLSRK